MTRLSTSAARRTTCRSATSPRWSATPCPDQVCRSPTGAGPDLRNYRVDFAKLAGTFPELSLRWSIREGVAELVRAYTDHGLTYDDFMSSRFVRLRRINELMAAGLIDEMMRRPHRRAVRHAGGRDRA